MSRRAQSLFHYALVVGVLAVSAIYIHMAKARGGLRIVKKPLPIRKPLIDMNREALAPFEIISSRRLPSEIIEDLGTTEYIEWVLKVPRSKGLPTHRITLLVTYYTDVQDQIPHVPEECYYQGAFSSAGDDDLLMEMARTEVTIPVRRLSFYPPREFSKKCFVYYTICVNGDFFSNRQFVRLRMADPFDTHLYYSKVEISYPQATDRDLSDLDNNARELLDKVIHELIQSHWPKMRTERNGGVTNPDMS